jgi:hypothetical protein
MLSEAVPREGGVLLMQNGTIAGRLPWGVFTWGYLALPL